MFFVHNTDFYLAGVTSLPKTTTHIRSYYEYQLPHSTHIFSDSFASGNLWAWSTYPMDTDMQVTAAAALDGDNKGVAVVLAGNDTLILGDDSPNQAANYHARFKFSPNSVSHGTTYQTIFSGKNASGAEVFRLEFRKYGSYYYLRPSYRRDNLTWVNGTAYTLLNAANEIEIYWRAATGAGANNGICRLWLNGTQRLNVTTIDNDTFRLEAAAFQFKDDASSSGTLYLDAFTSWADSSLAHERKYYSAGSGSVAMRVDGVLFYLLGDHLGSTSLTTHANGQVHSEMKYKPYGEMRLVNGQSPTDIGYTGQRAVMGIGLHFYNARHYDSSLGRFVEADSIVPGMGIAMAFDRYMYVFGNPLRYVDPSGHHTIKAENDWDCGPDGYMCTDGYVNHQHQPDHVDQDQLSQANDNILYSGEMMYELYKDYWMQFYGSTVQWRYDFDGDGMLTVIDLLFLILSYEFSPIKNADEQFVSDLSAAGRNWYGCSPDGNTNACSYAPLNGTTSSTILNWLGGLESARKRYDSGFPESGRNDILATAVGTVILQPYLSSWEYHTYNIGTWGNLIPMFPESAHTEMRYAPINVSDTGITNSYGMTGLNPFVILTPNQDRYWKGQ